jgi:putative phosphoribosyl transferase
MNMIPNRQAAAEELAERLKKYKGEDGIVLAIPRGGVPIGVVIANELGFPVEVILTKKIGHPSNPEFAIGAVSMTTIDLNEAISVPESYVKEETERIHKELSRRYQLFMGDHKPTDLHNKVVIIVDDGIATGHTLMATVELVKKQNPKKVVIAVPVGPPSAIRHFEELADEVVCLLAPHGFYAVGQFYEDFREVSDEEVIEWLRGAKQVSND